MQWACDILNFECSIASLILVVYRCSAAETGVGRNDVDVDADAAEQSSQTRRCRRRRHPGLARVRVRSTSDSDRSTSTPAGRPAASTPLHGDPSALTRRPRSRRRTFRDQLDTAIPPNYVRISASNVDASPYLLWPRPGGHFGIARSLYLSVRPSVPRRSCLGWAYPAININSCLQALTKYISTPADSALETIIFYCFVGYISALTCFLLLIIIGTLAACSLATIGHQRCADCGPVSSRMVFPFHDPPSQTLFQNDEIFHV